MTLIAAMLFGAPLAEAAAEPARVVVVTVTKGYRHESIPTAERVIGELASSSNWFRVTTWVREESELATALSAEALREIDLVMFVNTTGDLPLPDEAAFYAWLARGGAFVGVHSASDTLHASDAYLDMLGGEFDGHGPETSATIVVEAPHPSTAFLGQSITAFEEYYRIKRFDASKESTLLALHADTESGEPGLHPLAWCHRYGEGRVFYTALGHRIDIWESPWFRQHLFGGMAWAIAADRPATRRRAVRP